MVVETSRESVFPLRFFSLIYHDEGLCPRFLYLSCVLLSALPFFSRKSGSLLSPKCDRFFVWIECLRSSRAAYRSLSPPNILGAVWTSTPFVFMLGLSSGPLATSTLFLKVRVSLLSSMCDRIFCFFSIGLNAFCVRLLRPIVPRIFPGAVPTSTPLVLTGCWGSHVVILVTAPPLSFLFVLILRLGVLHPYFLLFSCSTFFLFLPLASRLTHHTGTKT